MKRIWLKIKNGFKKAWKWLVALVIGGSVVVSTFNGAIVEHNFDIGKGEAVYGVHINTETGEERYYDINKKFYDNTDKIKEFQIKYNDRLMKKEVSSSSFETI
jgi:hypothetical protein